MFAGIVMACSSPNVSPPPLGLVGDWEMIEGQVEGQPFPLVDGFRITVNFAVDGTFGGTAACNGYGGSYVADAEDLIIGEDVFATEMGCEGPVMDSEAAFLSVLRQPLTYERVGDLLKVSGRDSLLEFRAVSAVPAAALIGTLWTLSSWGTGEAVTNALGDPATLVLSENGQIRGSTGCRGLEGEYLLDADTVKFTTFTALGDCPNELFAQDSHVVTVLGDGFTVGIDGDSLTATSTGSEFLIYRR